MVTTIQRRVSRLEEAAGGDCPDCGGPSGADPDDHSGYEIVWVDPGGPDDREEFCEECGRQLVYVLTWGDEA
jgi:hypothetical protein